jgi:16S rRNA (uracil1498-N3)-methyltransferase
MSTVHRFFVDRAEVQGDRFPTPPSIERQVRRVLRLGDGAAIVLLPGDGTQLRCRLDGVACVVEERGEATGEPAHRLTVVQALLKGDGLEEVVRQGTEVGVAAFRLVVSERSVARELSERRLDRLRAIARESAEQSERGIVPRVHPPVPLADAIGANAVILSEREGGPRLRDIDPPAVVVIGPEGGFTDAELRRARDAGAAAVGLGPRILRARTVAAAVGAAILSRTGDFA